MSFWVKTFNDSWFTGSNSSPWLILTSFSSSSVVIIPYKSYFPYPFSFVATGHCSKTKEIYEKMKVFWYNCPENFGWSPTPHTFSFIFLRSQKLHFSTSQNMISESSCTLRQMTDNILRWYWWILFSSSKREQTSSMIKLVQMKGAGIYIAYQERR